MHQVCYASECTAQKEFLSQDLLNIYNDGQKLSQKNGITGVLYFVDGYLFECLEGTQEALNIVLNTIQKDMKHHQFKVFAMKKIDQRFFKNWTMKFISKQNDIHVFCKELGFEVFRPYDFEQTHIDALLLKIKQNNV